MFFDEFLSDFVDQKLESVEMSFVAEIISFDFHRMRATIRPLLKYENQYTSIPVPEIPDVPVEFFYGGGYFIRPAYVRGDLVTVSAYASSPDTPVESGLPGNGLAERFSLTNVTVRNGIAPKTISESAFSSEGLLIGKGSVTLLFSGTDIQIEGDVAVTGNLTLEGDIDVTGNLSVDGDISATGDVVADGDVKAGPNAISLMNHTHSFVNAVGITSETLPPTAV